MSSSTDHREFSAGNGARFGTTQWTAVLQAGAGAEEALIKLCRIYWPPLYSYVRRRGHPMHEAQDLTQAFFAHILENRALGTVSPCKGRFRSFLLASLIPRESAMDGVNSWEMTAYATNQNVWYNVLPTVLGFPSMAHYAQTPSSQQSFYARGNLFHCPSARFSDVSATYPNFSLAINSKLMRDFESAPSPITTDTVHSTLQMKQIRLPEKTALFLDCGVPGEDQITPFQTAFTGQPKAYANQFSGRHKGGGNILFVAGHAQTLPGPQVV